MSYLSDEQLVRSFGDLAAALANRMVANLARANGAAGEELEDLMNRGAFLTLSVSSSRHEALGTRLDLTMLDGTVRPVAHLSGGVAFDHE